MPKNVIRFATCSSLAPIMAVLMCSTSHAQAPDVGMSESPTSASDGGGTDIVVTAQRREQKLQDVPIAITAVTSEELTARNVFDLQSISSVAPSVQITGAGGVAGNHQVSIRGISGQGSPIGTAQPVATYIDGEYLPTTDAAFFTLDDVERVEVLRGPQGTLYGRNSTAGAINIITRLPGQDLKAGFDVSYGNYDHVLARGSVSGPLAGGLSAGVSASYETRHGFVKNSTTGNPLDDLRSYVLRGKLYYQSPDENFSILAAADTWRRDNPSTVWSSLYNPAGNVFVGLPNPSSITVPARADDTYINDNKSEGQAITLTYKASPQLQFTSITTHRNYRVDISYYTPVFNLAGGSIIQYKTFNSEFRGNYTGDWLTITAGVNYYRSDQLYATQSPHTLGTTLPYANPRDTSNLEAVGVFGQAEITVAPDLTLVGGARYIHETQDFVIDYSKAAVPGPLINGSVKANKPIFNGGVNYKPDSDILLYAKVSQGYQAPGFNNSIRSESAFTFRPEKLLAYEAGIKSQFFGRLLTFNLAGFYYDYKDLQVRNIVTVGVQIIENAASAKIKGLEASLVLRPVRGLTLSGDLSWTDATYKSFCEGNGGSAPPANDAACINANGIAGWDRSGNYLSNSPKWSGSVSANYNLPVGPGEFRTNIGYNFSSKAYFSPANELPISRGGIDKLDARIGYKVDGFEIYAYGQNLTNRRFASYPIRALYTPINFVVSPPNDPRTYGVGIKYNF